MKNNVTIISLQKTKNKYIASTSIGEYEFDEDSIIKFGVFKDKEFSKSEFDEILNYVDISKAMNKTVVYLSYKSRTKKEVETYLSDFASKEIVISKLEKLGYLNDEIYCKDYLNYCIRNKKGPNYFISKLTQKGIEKLMCEEFASNYTSTIQNDLILKISEDFINKNSDKPILKLKTSLVNKLYRDGFDQELIYAFVNTYEFIDNSEELLVKDYEKKRQQLSSRNLDEEIIKQKITAYLINKGYPYSNIKKLF